MNRLRGETDMPLGVAVWVGNPDVEGRGRKGHKSTS